MDQLMMHIIFSPGTQGVWNAIQGVYQGGFYVLPQEQCYFFMAGDPPIF